MRLRFVLTTVPMMLLVWLGLAGYLMQKHQAGINDAEADSRIITEGFEEYVRRSVEVIDTTLRTARVARARDPAHFDLAAWERDSGLTRELTLQLALTDRNGTVIASNLGPIAGPRATVADRDHFRIPRDTEGDNLFISRPVLGRVSGRWSVQVVRKLFDANGAFDGVIVASLNPDFLSHLFHSLGIGRGALLLLGPEGMVRAAAPVAAAGLAMDLSATLLMREASAKADGTMRMNATPDSIERVYSWRRVEPYGLIAVVGLSTEDALADYRQDLKGCMAIGAGMTMLILIVGWVIAYTRRDVIRSREMLRAAVENISQGLVVVDPQRRVPVLNARAAELLELPANLAFPGVDFDSLLEWQLETGELDSQDDAAIRRLAESGGIDRGTSVYRRVRRNGVVLEVRTKVLESGLAVRTYTDITDQQRAARMLADARDSAEAMARARSEFLAVMSHEIRTPLNGVIGVAGLLEEMELGPSQRDHVRLIRQSGQHLLELVNHILDFSRLEADRVDLEEVDFDPRALLQGAVNMFLTESREKDLHLSAVIDNSVPPLVSGDSGRLRQVLLNLVGNAVKFTNRGSVQLTLGHEATADGHVRLLFTVADSGIGIAPEAIERMFQAFTQMDSSISRRFGGSGLGLAICRRLVELMGGRITVESEPGAGSTFHFDVLLNPSRGTQAADAADAEAAPASALRVLVAEDNPTNRLVAVRLLQRLGHQADAVGNGAEAIAALGRERYDLVLMDVMMPEMDGLNATRRIRAAEGNGQRLPIIGLTAGAGSLAACLEAGMDAVTTKPVTAPRLRAAIAEGMGAIGPGPGDGGLETATPRLRELAGMLGTDAVAEIVRTFAEDTRAHVQVMKQAAAADDTNTIYRCAHSVAGAARNVGADALAARAASLEQRIGTYSTTQIALEIAALQRDFDAALTRMGIDASANG